MTMFTFTEVDGTENDRGWPYHIVAGFINLYRDEVSAPAVDGETATYRDQFGERVTVECRDDYKFDADIRED